MVVQDPGSSHESTRVLRSVRKTYRKGGAVVVRRESKPKREEKPRKGNQVNDHYRDYSAATVGD